jgi:hypothetical protein
MLALGADPTNFLDDTEDQFPMWVRILRRAEEIHDVHRENDLNALVAGTSNLIVGSLM